MSFTLTVQSPVLLLLLFSVVSIRASSVYPPWWLELPEIDGSAVDNNCRNFYDATPTTLTVEPATPAATRAQLMKTTPKPTIRSPRKPEPTAPIQTQPAVRAPLSRDAVLRLLHLLLTNRRGGAARPPQTGDASSSSEEPAVAFWKVQTFPSKDSSEES
ncbi:uncharacterized protein LOC112156122 [Oryzias melastigma]|uniref:uncharacterized protein LOC112156122 n=1 Tax=Oryzias melastigma TaxID=30732 RepID=UPI00168D50A2|nr:uncharacterized protein LOC112156122 [Oryzias melastigma]